MATPVIASNGGGMGMGSGGSGNGFQSPSSSAPMYDPAIDYQKGVAALKAQDYKSALKSLRNVLSASPRDANTNYLVGVALRGTGDNKRAADYFEKATKYDKTMLIAWRELGVTRAKLGDVPGATVARDALSVRLAACAMTCTDKTGIQAAIDTVSAAITAGPQARLGRALPPALRGTADGDHAYLQAVSLINQHRYGDAIASLQAARWVFGAHPDILTYIGFANRKLGRYADAEGYYRAALAIFPKHRGALEYYGELKVERGDLPGARGNLALLDRSCTFGCYEAEELRRWIVLGRDPLA